MSPSVTLIGAPVQLMGEGWQANDRVVVLLSEQGLTPTLSEEVARTSASITGTIQITFTVPSSKRWQRQSQVRVIAQRSDSTASAETLLRISGVLFTDAEGPQTKPFENEALSQLARGMVITSDEEWRAVEAEALSPDVGEPSEDAPTRRPAPYERFRSYLPPDWLWPYAPSFIPTPTPVSSGLVDWDEYVLVGFCLGEDMDVSGDISILSIRQQGRKLTVVVDVPGESEEESADGGVTVRVVPLENLCAYALVARADLPSGNANFVFVAPEGDALDQVDLFLPASKLTPVDRSNER